MKCKRCKNRPEMKIGKAINPEPDWAELKIIREFNWPIRAEDVRLEDVWKCPKCGHSEMKESK